MQNIAENAAGNGCFTPETAAGSAKRSHLPNGKRYVSALRQALDLQRALHKAGVMVGKDVCQVEGEELRARMGASLASIAKGWDSLTARVQILRGKAAPGTLSPAERRAAKEQRTPPIQAHPRPAPKPAPPCPD